MNGNDLRVLHVDDDPSILDLTAAFLGQELDDVSVATETAPDAALERVESEWFDCVISDYDMPEQDGLELFEAIREEQPLVPVLLYTGKGSEEIASQAVNAGVTGYFQKGGPDQQRRLANRVRQAASEYHTRIEADRYSTVLRALDYPIYVVDETGKFSYVNDAMLEMTGHDRDEIIGESTALIKDEKAVQKAESELGSILSSEAPDTSQFRVDIVPKNGDPIPCRDHMGVLPYEGEEFRGSIGILRNIRDDVRREAKLDQLNDELNRRTRAMDEAPVGISITDPDRDDNPMIHVNDRFVEMTGYSREESIGQNCRFLQGPDTDEEAVEELRSAIEAGESTTVELKNYRKNGEPFWNRVSVSPLVDEDGEVSHWVGFQQDVTEYKNKQQELERQNDRLEQFASIVSHDLRSPISVAKGRIELANQDGDENLDAAQDALDRIETIVEDTLLLAQHGDTVGELGTVELSNIIPECWRTADTAEATFEINEDATIRADADRLRNLLENLFINAVDHGGESVTVRVGPLGDGFYVADDGPGIPAADRDEVFTPGYTTATDGTGFGLAIVDEIAGAHGWSVDVTESEHGGARFEIRGVEMHE
jgi:PAS domain S-box-containing protein